MKGYDQIRGFTLIEALIAVAVLGVLAAMAIPSMTALLRDNQASRNTSDIMTSLLLARSAAVTRNVMVSVCKRHTTTPGVCNNAGSWQDGWIAFEDDDRDGVRDVGEEILETISGLSTGTTVTVSGFTNFVSYLPSGAVTVPGSFTVCVAGTVARDLIVNATGRPRIADANCP